MSASPVPPLRPIARRRPREILRIAHRGGAGGKADYSAAQLGAIVAQGAHLVELDLHVTLDDQLVVHHDPTITYAGASWWITDRTLAELRAVIPEDVIPSAATVFRAAHDAELGLYVDIKTLSPAAANQLVELLHAERMLDRVILASARSDIVARCAKAAPEIPRAVLFNSTQEEPLQLARSVGADFVHPCWEAHPRPDRLLTGGWLERVRFHNLGVICWHEERLEVIEALYELGVDGVCTDQPELLTTVATATGHHR